MLRPYDLLESVLIDIETGIRAGVDVTTLAEKYTLSYRHLQRLFTFAFKQTLGSYIRSRRLAASLEDLLKTNANILDIALEYGFYYEQSYIYAFKREFGITPGDLRKSGHIVKVKPPLHIFDENKLGNGLLFGPDIVMVPQFHVVGKLHRIPFSKETTFAQGLGIDFWFNERNQITSVINPTVYIGISRNRNITEEHTEYMASVQVRNFNNVPEGLTMETFDASLCARFRYVGHHNYSELNCGTAKEMYEAIWKFANDENSKYALLIDKIRFEKINVRLFDGNYLNNSPVSMPFCNGFSYCEMEWFTPVMEKSIDTANNSFVPPYYKGGDGK